MALRTIGDLSKQELESVKARWIDLPNSDESSRDIDAAYNLSIGSVRKHAWRQNWKAERPSVDAPPKATVNDDGSIQEKAPERTYEGDVKIERLQSRLRHTERLYKQAVKEKAAVDRLVETIYDAIVAADPVTPYKATSPVLGEGEHGAVALLSDVHIGEVVSAEETNNLSEYDSEKFVERLHIWTEKVIGLTELRRSRMHVPNLELFMLGDVVSGDIHEELSNTNDVNVVEQVVSAVYHLSGVLLTLCQNFEQVNVAVVAGNHGRMKRKPYFKAKQISNWDYLIGLMLALNLRNQPNLSWHIPDTHWTVRDVLGTRFLLMHGDGIMSWNGIPHYGIQRMVGRLMTLVGRDMPIDRIVMGHFHDPVDTERYHINGNFKGGDEYSIGKMHVSGRPSQTMLYVHPENGVVGTERIYLDGGRKEFKIIENTSLRALLGT